MFTADVPAAIEARQQLTPRSLAASFQYVLTKPFDIDELVEVVTTAARQPMRAAN
jgi:CheY-like chemotaxis protein